MVYTVFRKKHPFSFFYNTIDISQINVVVSGPKFTKFLLFNVEGMVVDNAVYRLSISPSILEIFALKVESCPKSRRILDVFAIPNFKGAVPPQICTHVISAT